MAEHVAGNRKHGRRQQGGQAIHEGKHCQSRVAHENSCLHECTRLANLRGGRAVCAENLNSDVMVVKAAEQSV